MHHARFMMCKSRGTKCQQSTCKPCEPSGQARPPLALKYWLFCSLTKANTLPLLLDSWLKTALIRIGVYSMLLQRFATNNKCYGSDWDCWRRNAPLYTQIIYTADWKKTVSLFIASCMYQRCVFRISVLLTSPTSTCVQLASFQCMKEVGLRHTC